MTLEEMVTGHEGIRFYPYDDATGQELKPGMVLRGNVTIGIGRNLSGQGITSDEVHLLLANDLKRVRHELSTALAFWPKLSQRRQEALLDMAFNLGLTRFLRFSLMLKALSVGDYQRAAREMLASYWAHQTGKRARELAYIVEHDAEAPGEV